MINTAYIENETMTEETPEEDKNRLISMTEAAELYGFTSRYFRQLASKGRIEAKKYGNYWLTTPMAIEEFISNRKITGFYRDDIQSNNDK